MKISVIDTKENELSLLFEGVTADFMNVLRRAITFETPTVAIDDVYFTENSSALYDEIVAHRLGLIPIKVKGLADLQNVKKVGEKFQTVFDLKKEGPGMVYSGDLVPKSKDVKILYPKTPIVKLTKNQKIDLKASAVMGTGKTHLKWSPALSYYSNYTTAKVSGKNIKGENATEFSRKLLDLGEAALKLEGINSKGEIKVSQDKFIFTIESWGQMTPKELLEASVKVIKEKIKDLKVK